MCFAICITLALLYLDLSTLFTFLEIILFFHIYTFRGEVNPQFFEMLQKIKKEWQLKFSSLFKTVLCSSIN